MISTTRMILCGVLFALTLLSGLWVTGSGRPLNTVIFTIHKLIALAAVVLTGISLAPVVRAVGWTLPLAGLIALGAVLALALFASGALLSVEKPASLVVLRIHQIAPLLALGALALAAALLVSGKLLAGS